MANLGRSVRDYAWAQREARRIRRERARRPALDLAFERELCQQREEIEGFLELVAERRPRAVVEIGTYMGGTLLSFTDAAADDAVLVTVDLPEGYDPRRASLYRSFARARQRVVPIRADSHDPETVERVRAEAARPVDMLFIDGDHSYDGARSDFEAYGPLVRPGGLVAFHDITPGPGSGDVHRLWDELEARYERTTEFRAAEAGYGIGVLELPAA